MVRPGVPGGLGPGVVSGVIVADGLDGGDERRAVEKVVATTRRLLAREPGTTGHHRGDPAEIASVRVPELRLR